MFECQGIVKMPRLSQNTCKGIPKSVTLVSADFPMIHITNVHKNIYLMAHAELSVLN